MPKGDEIRIPAIGSNSGTSLEQCVAHIRYTDDEAGLTWYILEFDGVDRFFGVVAGRHVVVGEFTLTELQNLIGDEGPAVRRDPDFTPETLLGLASQVPGLREILPPEDDLVELR